MPDRMEPFFEIPAYHAFLSPVFARALLARALPAAGIPGLTQIGDARGLETAEALSFLTQLYQDVKTDLASVLRQREADRNFLDARVPHASVLGLTDAKGRVVIGPLTPHYKSAKPGAKPVAPLPEFLRGPHVTLFGPPDSAKLSINAMNAYHRKLPSEPPIVEKLLNESGIAPFWGADDEDSKTPLRADLVEAGVNLTAGFEGTLSLDEGAKSYRLATDHLALPIKRFPGLALPTSFLFLNGNPLPLHLYDFALHVFRHWRNTRALVFYVPKLENEEEARYIHTMIAAAERRLKQHFPAYVEGSVRLMIVLENPRAILRAHEIMDALHPYFAGASLGWHDYLASTARLLREDASYRIPVKADPGIVIKYIKASHRLLAETVGSRGGIKVGGMYGILPTAGDEASLQVTLKGFFKDVITQMKRDLTGFWVAHPDFVRIGIALVQAWKNHAAGDASSLRELTGALLEAKHRDEILRFIAAPDIEGLDESHPDYVRSLLVADIKESDFIANNHPDEIRYNVFQMLQYLADWLSGNGCVALPTVVENVPVRVMDDLATAERSRWEVWAEIFHGRFSREEFLRIANDELNFIRRDLSTDKKIVQVKWDERTGKWYPAALEIMLRLMLNRKPVEFATELLLPFTAPEIRASADPWAMMLAQDPEHYRLDRDAAGFQRYFSACGSARFASEMAKRPLEDLRVARELIFSFSLDEVIEAAGYHGDIGQSRKTLDHQASAEQARVLDDAEAVKLELRALGEKYRAKFGVKFLISAQGRSAAEIRAALVRRLEHTADEELLNAREALWQIAEKRLLPSSPRVLERLESLRLKHGVVGAGLAINQRGFTQSLGLGEASKGGAAVSAETRFEIASLSKTVATALAMSFFEKRGVSLSTPVNRLFAAAGSPFRLQGLESATPVIDPDAVSIEHLLNHTALGMHYVSGFPVEQGLPPVTELLAGAHGYEPARVIGVPGRQFHYSGGGFLVLEHLLEVLSGKPADELASEFLASLGLQSLVFSEAAIAGGGEIATGYFDSGEAVPGGRLQFPRFAAGALSSAGDVAKFLADLTIAHRDLESPVAISHDTAVQMLHGRDLGSREFMRCEMGLGVFTIEAGANRFMLHQGANEGFRALFLQCFAGPDRGKGVVLLVNGDNKAVPFIAEAAALLLEELAVDGIDFSSLRQQLSRPFDPKGYAQAEIVNLGYKQLLLGAFRRDLPESIARDGARPAPWSHLNHACGAIIINFSNQKFARAENLLSPYPPTFDPELFGRQGKIMDSWESARHNPHACDWLVFQVEKNPSIQFVSLSTKYHDGNHPEFVRVLGRTSSTGRWFEIVPKTEMQGHSLRLIELAAPTQPLVDVQVEMYPDGGLTRVGLFTDRPAELEAEAGFKFARESECVRFAEPIPKTLKPLTLPFAASPLGRVVRASNEHYGPATQVISPYPPLHMFDGLESARSRVPGHHEEVVIELAQPRRLTHIDLDFTFFVNNNPVAVSLHGWPADAKTPPSSSLSDGWIELVGKTSVKAYAGGIKRFVFSNPHAIRQLLVRTYPDGGINRIRF